MEVPHDLVSFGPVVSEKIFEHIHTHTHTHTEREREREREMRLCPSVLYSVPNRKECERSGNGMLV